MDQHDALSSELQALINGVANETGFGVGIGYVDVDGHDIGLGAGPRTPAGLSQNAEPGRLTGTDTYVLGSGTKPFTAVCIMRLVDAGRVSLDDVAHKHVDGPMRRMWNTTMVEMFGARAMKVTVGQLIRMRSGLGDFDTPRNNGPALKRGTLHDPLSDLQFLADQPGPFGCRVNDGCTWACEPGTCTSYSSANLLLANLVLLAHAPDGQDTWRTFRQNAALGPDFSSPRYGHTNFPTVGPLPDNGLTTAALSGSLDPSDPVEIFAQDASIMGFGYGNAVSAPRDVARFFFDLFGPGRKFVSASSLAAMRVVHTLDTTWLSGKGYGAGLEVRSVSPMHVIPPVLTDFATFIGHEGVTYGFWSTQGWFPQLNGSLAVFTTQDFKVSPATISCNILKVIARHRGLHDGGLQCAKLPWQWTT
jgi:CubicO group peptidase (beta-lactamase class C family)